jgi:hypothetical protein
VYEFEEEDDAEEFCQVLERQIAENLKMAQVEPTIMECLFNPKY